MRILTRPVLCGAVASLLFLAFTPVNAAPPMKPIPSPVAGSTRVSPAQALLPYDLSIDSVTIQWKPLAVRVVVRVQGTPPASSAPDRNLTCWLDYSGIPEEFLHPPSSGAYAFTPPATHEMKVTSFFLAGGPTHLVMIPFNTFATQVTARCKAWPDPAESNPNNNDRTAFSTKPPAPGEALRYILDFSATPQNDAGKHLKVLLRVTNQTQQMLQGLRLILVKNHLPLTEWKPIGLHAGGLAQLQYLDSMPAPTATNNYEAILTTDLASPLPPPGTVLDRRSISYRTAATLVGVP